MSLAASVTPSVHGGLERIGEDLIDFTERQSENAIGPWVNGHFHEASGLGSCSRPEHGPICIMWLSRTTYFCTHCLFEGEEDAAASVVRW